MAKANKINLSYSARPVSNPIRCKVCGKSIPESNYALFVTIRVNGLVLENKPKIIHDNDGVCLEALKVKLGLSKPSFKSNVPFHMFRGDDR